MENQNKLAIFEAILFASGEPLEMEKAAEAMEISFDDVFSLFEQLNEKYKSVDSGLCVLRLQNKLQLCTKKEYHQYVRNVLEIKRNTPLSQAAFEVLAVIAYNQPVTKSFIEQVRGVDCSGVVSSLCEKGLIEEKGRLDLPGRPLLYGTTDSFMRCFELSSLSDLPPIPHDDNYDKNEEDNDEQKNELVTSDSLANEDADINIENSIDENIIENEQITL